MPFKEGASVSKQEIERVSEFPPIFCHALANALIYALLGLIIGFLDTAVLGTPD